MTPALSPDPPLPGETIVVLAASAPEARQTCETLESGVWKGRVVGDEGELESALHEGCGALVVAEEACSPAVLQTLERMLGEQPAWSDLPILLLQSPGVARDEERSRLLRRLPRGNWSLFERPLMRSNFLWAVEFALKARARQYQVRDLLEEKDAEVARRDEFLAMLGHELRNPLAAIRYAVELLDALDESAETRAPREVIARQTRHLSHLVDDLLDVARVTRGKITLDAGPLELNDLARKTLDSLHDAHFGNAHRIELSPHDEPLVVEGDATRLEQVLSNLVANAVKFTPNGGQIKINLEREDDFARLTVEDNGIGMNEEFVPHAFDLFSQGTQSLDRSRGGLGIGLTLVRGLVELHGGQVTAHSQGVGLGSRFEVCLPLHFSARQTAKSTPAPEASASRRVVVIEDNDDARELLCLLLKREGHVVEWARDGQAGLKLLLEKRPDIAFVDVGLPELSGYEIAECARKQLRNAVRLVAMSGYGQPEDEARALEAGFDQHLTKPVAPEELHAAIGKTGDSSECGL